MPVLVSISCSTSNRINTAQYKADKGWFIVHLIVILILIVSETDGELIVLIRDGHPALTSQSQASIECLKLNEAVFKQIKTNTTQNQRNATISLLLYQNRIIWHGLVTRSALDLENTDWYLHTRMAAKNH